jgi:hypothetical protein
MFRGGLLLACAASVALPSACGGRAMLGDDFEHGFGGDVGSMGGSRVEPEGGSAGRAGSSSGGGRGGAAGAGGVGGAAAGRGGSSAGAAGAAMAGAAGAVMSGGGGAAGSSMGGAAGSAGEPFPSVAFTGCTLTTPLEGGFSLCANGMLHRPIAGGECLNALPRPSAFAPDELFALEQAALNAGYTELEVSLSYACREDTDCTAQPNGYCALASPRGWTLGASFTQCRYACSTDADCGGGTLCECGEPGGQCVSAQCFVDSECGMGMRCAPYDATPGCDLESRIWACQRPGDECGIDAHCGAAQACAVIDGTRRCTPPSCE